MPNGRWIDDETDIGYDRHKYVVFRGDEWEKYRAKLEERDIPSILDRILPEEIDPATYFLLRRDDHAGRLGLSAYIEGLLLMQEIPLTNSQREHLSALGDDLFEMLAEWRRLAEAKVPD